MRIFKFDANNIFDIQFFSMIFHNFFNSKLQIEKGRLVPFKRSVIKLHKTARILLNGGLRINSLGSRRSRRCTTITIEKNAVLKINGAYSMAYNTDIVIFENAVLELEDGFNNINLLIRCADRIKIGNNVIMGPDVTIMDSDFHSLDDKNHQRTQPITIGNHVWLGSKATILKGVTIGDGSVIAAGAVVANDIPPNCLVAGVPAKVIRENVVWS